MIFSVHVKTKPSSCPELVTHDSLCPYLCMSEATQGSKVLIGEVGVEQAVAIAVDGWLAAAYR